MTTNYKNFCFALVVFLALCVLFAVSVPQANALDQARSRLIDVYMNFAFRANQELIKFDKRPRVLVICDNPKCQRIADQVRLNLPSEDYFEVSSAMPVNPTNFEIFVFFDVTSAEKTINDFKSSKSNNLENRYWGGPECSVHQFYRGNIVNKLFVESLNSNDDLSSVVCLLLEFARGSGGNVNGSFETYRDQFLQAPFGERTALLAGIAFVLRMHWSPFIAPGTSKGEVRGLVEKYMF